MGESLLTVIVSVLSGINLLELIGFILFYRQNKKAKELENDGKQNENIDKLVETTQKVIDILEDKFNDSENDSKAKGAKIDELLKEKETLISEKFQLLKEKQRAELELIKANYLKCEVQNCPKRQPPTGY